MIDLYFWPTPNGRKVSIMLEECGTDYDVHPVDIGRGDQFDPGFLEISPNNKMPAITDRESGISVFESGAILMYLAEKTGQFLPESAAERYSVLQWLFWQVGGLGPMAGQLSHFRNYAKVPFGTGTGLPFGTGSFSGLPSGQAPFRTTSWDSVRDRQTPLPLRDRHLFRLPSGQAPFRTTS